MNEEETQRKIMSFRRSRKAWLQEGKINVRVGAKTVIHRFACFGISQEVEKLSLRANYQERRYNEVKNIVL